MNTEDELAKIEIDVLKGQEDELRLVMKALQNKWTRDLFVKDPRRAYDIFMYLISLLPERGDVNIDELVEDFDHKGRPQAIIEYAKKKSCEIKDWDRLLKIIDRYFSFILIDQENIKKPAQRNSIIKTFYIAVEHLFGDSMKTQARNELVGYICYLYDLIPIKNNENPSDRELEDRVRYALNEKSSSESLILENKLDEFLKIITT